MFNTVNECELLRCLAFLAVMDAVMVVFLRLNDFTGGGVLHLRIESLVFTTVAMRLSPQRRALETSDAAPRFLYNISTGPTSYYLGVIICTSSYTKIGK